MKTYFVRAGKYLIFLTVLLFAIYYLMNMLGGVAMPVEGLFESSRGYLVIAILLFFAAVHPYMGYVKRSLVFDASKKVDEVVNVMSMCGYTRTNAGDATSMTFRATTKTKRMIMLGEDEISITTTNELSTMSGPRKEVVRASFRFTTFID